MSYVLITGTTGGIGSEILKKLVKLNYNLILLNRSVERSEQQREELLKLANVDIKIVQCDLTDMNSIDHALSILKDMEFDYFMMNAGIYNVKLFKTNSGYNNVFQTNYVSHYYILRKLVEVYKKKIKKVIVVGSIAYKYKGINVNDIDFSNNKHSSQIYGNSKRFLMFTLMNYDEVNITICHPGITLTKMTNHYPKFINWLVKIGIKILFHSPKKAADCIIAGMDDDTGNMEWIGPRVFDIWGKPKKKIIKGVKQEEIDTICSLSEYIYNNVSQERGE